MCGIAGLLVHGGAVSHAELCATAERMSGPLRHRGPDGEGVWADESHGIAFGHRRLAVIDLTPTGQQPMVSRDGKQVLTYNGELYNHADLRSELETVGVAFRGTSDTEVLLEAIAHWGVRAAVERTNGMFAFAVWDRARAVLTLARDRVGEKPLYFGWLGKAFVFGSELAALRAHPYWRGQLDPTAVAGLMRFGAVPAPRSIYSGIHKLEAATILHIDVTGGTTAEQYWDLADIAGMAQALDYPAASEAVDALLDDSTRLRLAADVPVGCFLSGGVDSTLMTAVATRAVSTVKTFSIGFDEPTWDEGPYARAVAAALGTDHTEMSVSGDDLLAQIDHLSSAYSEPFADSSQLPTMLLAELTRRHVTVALSGDGADELFGGYARYRLPASLAWRLASHLPAWARRATAWLLDRAPLEWMDGLAASPFIRSRINLDRPSGKLRRFGTVLAAEDWWRAYQLLVSPESPAVGSTPFRLDVVAAAESLSDPFDRVQLFDQLLYLPDDLLVKTDRATMASSLEARLPYLDHRLVELSWQLPRSAKFHEGKGKRILRDLVASEVPPSLVDRPKRGFGVPLEVWLRGPLREWAGDLVGSTVHDYLDQASVARLWTEHLDGRDRSRALWPVLVLRAWIAADAPIRAP